MIDRKISALDELIVPAAGDFLPIVDISVDGFETKRITAANLGVGGGGAPADVQYLVLVADAGLTVERVLTPGSGLIGADGGPGLAYTLNLGALTANWDAGPYKITALILESDQATGTAPLIVASTTVVANLNADMVDGKHAADLSITIDTRANILAATPDAGIAYANDIERFYVADGTSWFQIVPNGAVADAEAPDMGYEKDSARTGYGDDYITDKKLSNVLIGGNARTENGGIRVDVTQDPDTLEIYLRAAWQTILYDLSVEDGDFRHTPIGEEIYVWRGNSVLLGLNGRPIINEYEVSMGAFPTPRILNGGAF